MSNARHVVDAALSRGILITTFARAGGGWLPSGPFFFNPHIKLICLGRTSAGAPKAIAFSGIRDKIRCMNAVTVNPKVQGGLPCFAGTRVPVSSLFDHLVRGYTVKEFLDDFPTVTKEQVDAVLDMAKADIPNHAQRVPVQ